jgi:biopolymer transport protein ExbD
MISTTFVTQPGIRIDLPKANTKVKNVAQESNTIIISADNSIYINRQQMESIEQLRSELVKLKQANSSELIIIKADENVAHGIVVSVMDLAKTSGFSRIAIATR